MSNPIADFPWVYSHVDASRQVQTGQGALHTIVVNGLSANGVVEVWDGVGAAGVLIAILSMSVAFHVSLQPITLTYDVRFETGLYLGFDDNVTVDFTVSYV